MKFPSGSVSRSCSLWVFLVLAVLGPEAFGSGAEPGNEARMYKIAQSYPYPPWDVGPFKGVSIEVMKAICDANRHMKCQYIAVPSEECFDTDESGKPFVGPVLASGRADGCLTWFKTAARERLGVEFGHGYSRGSTPQLIAADSNPAFDGLGAEGSLGGAEVAFFAGFFSDAACLGAYYSNFNALNATSDDAARAALVDDLMNGVIDLIFWDSLSTVPAGAHPVGEPILTCGPDELGLAVYPPATSRKAKSDALRRDYNCGLALIRQNGVLEQICSNSPHPGGDPACLLEGPPPTIQCSADNQPEE